MTETLRERLKSLYEAFRLARIDFVLNAFDDDVEFISYSPLEVFPFLGHHRGKAAMADVLKAGIITRLPSMTNALASAGPAPPRRTLA